MQSVSGLNVARSFICQFRISLVPSFVLAVRANNVTNMTATHFRTYTNPRIEDPFAKYPIWQAGRATSAAPAYFARMKIGDWEYVDGGMSFNNPVLM